MALDFLKVAQKFCASVSALAISFTFSVSVSAHPGGHDRIMTLNEQIAHEPKNAYLVIKRAQELIQEEQNFVPAKADLDKARSLGATESTSHEVLECGLKSALAFDAKGAWLLTA